MVDVKHREENKTETVLEKQDVLSVVAKLFNSKEFVVQSYNFTKCPSSEPASRTIGCWKLNVSLINSDCTPKSYNFFVKKLPSNPLNCYEKEMKSQAFQKEVELYSTLFADFANVEGVKTKNRWCPEMYFWTPGQTLVLEDLHEKGYYQVGRRECLNREQLLAAMRALAVFHAASVKLEKKIESGNFVPTSCANRPVQTALNVLYKDINNSPDIVSLNCHPGNSFLEAGIQSQLDLVDLLPGNSVQERNCIKTQLPGILQKVITERNPSKKYRNVLIHGDMRGCNIFFRRKGRNDTESVLVDYKMARYAPPAVDLMMLLHLNQEKVFRVKETQNMIQAYYNMFSEELDKCGVCIQDVVSVMEFLESCKECEEWVNCATVLYLQVQLLPDDVIEKYMPDADSYNSNMLCDRREMVREAFSRDAVYNSRMTEAMNELISGSVVFL